MANPQTRQDFENMSDEDFLKLSENDYSGNVPEGQSSLTSEESHVEQKPQEENLSDEDFNSTKSPDDNSESDPAGDQSDTSTDEDEEDEKIVSGNPDPMSEKGTPPVKEGESDENKQPVTDPQKEGEKAVEKEPVKTGKETPAKAGYYKLPEDMDTAAIDNAIGFYKAVTTPFKADGKDFSVRSPEDAIRLMQQGVNYSRRMQEIKPMKALNRMLNDQGLDDPNKLNFLIDLSKGNKEAIVQLLKSHKIDPMDLDIEKETGYQAPNYQGNPQDHDFRDALDNALTTPEGQALVSHIHKDWDKKSKAKLRENPSILGNLQEMKASGVYDKVVEELNYQKGLGYLIEVPFLQAFDQVGEAMKNAGVFNVPTNNPAPNGNSMAPLNTGQTQNQPLASGARKSTGVKKPETNQHLSSTPLSKQSSGNTPTTPDFDKLSDEEFLKMAPPE